MGDGVEHGLTINGPPGTAEIQWGYYTAARLGAWALAAGVLTADIEETNPVGLTQNGLTFVVQRPGGRPWTWPVRDLYLTGETALTATLGPKERL